MEVLSKQPLTSTKSEGNIELDRVEPTSAEMNPKLIKTMIRFSYNKNQQQWSLIHFVELL